MEGFVPCLSWICLKNVVFPDNSEPNIKSFNCIFLYDRIEICVIFLVVCCKIDHKFFNAVVVQKAGKTQNLYIRAKLVESCRKPAQQYFLFYYVLEGPHLAKKYRHALYLWMKIVHQSLFGFLGAKGIVRHE